MFSVRRKTAEVLYEAQDSRLRNHLRLDVSPSFRAPNLRGRLDVETAMAAIGERTLQVMGGFGDDQVIESSDASSVVLMPGPDRFEKLLERRLRQSFGLDQSTGSSGPQLALQMLGDDFAAWVEQAPQEVAEYAIFVDSGPQLQIRMRREPFLPSVTHQDDPKAGDLASIDPFKLPRRETGAPG